MPYELYERTSARADVPMISMTAGGRIALNAAAARLFLEAKVHSVVLLWDAAKNKMAIRAAAKGAENSFVVSFNKHHAGATMSGMNFLKHIRWNGQKKESLPAEWNAQQKMFEVTLPADFIGATTSRLTPKPSQRPAKNVVK
jgi:hypothetical protein